MKPYTHAVILFGLLAFFAVSSVFVNMKGVFIVNDPLKDVATKKTFADVKTAGKVVFVIIDALRFDFTQYFPENQDGTPLEMFKNNLVIINEKVTKNPEQSIHLKGFSDPPTATTQRVKALAIGNIPSYIEIIKTFILEKFEEDSIFLQLVNHNMELSHIGDDVWSGMFGDKFTRDFFADSLDIYDFNTIDDLVIEKIESEITNPTVKFIVAHFNGADHIGHAMNSDNKTMKDKLEQMNTQLTRMIELLNEDDVLILIGDHGMSQEGHHGGNTVEETSTGFFGFSKRGFVNQEFPEISNFDPTYMNSTNQIDLVPTFAMLLGLPVPFNNLGMVIPDFFPKGTSLDTIFNGMQENLKQIVENVYKQQQLLEKMSEKQFLFIANKFDQLSVEFNRITSVSNPAEKKSMQLSHINNLKEFAREIKGICLLAWNQLQLPLMLLGNLNLILATALGAVLMFYLTILSKQGKYSSCNISWKNRITKSTLLFVLVIFPCTIAAAFYADLDSNMIFGIALALLQCFTIVEIFKDISQIKWNMYKKNEENSTLALPQRIISIRTLIYIILAAFTLNSLNSLHSIRMEDTLILIAMALCLIVELVDTYVITKSNQEQKQNSLRLLWIPLIMYLAQYFDVTTNRVYVLYQIRFDWLRILMDYFVDFPVIIPALAFWMYVSSRQVFLSRWIKYIFSVNLLIGVVYFYLLHSSDLSLSKNMYFVNEVLPRTSYVLSVISAVLIYYFQRKTQPASSYILAQIFSLNVPLLMIMGKHSHYLSLAFHAVLEIYLRYASSRQLSSDPTTYLYFANLIQYFFLVSGHKTEIPSLQVLSAYVGMEKQSNIVGGFLLITNTYSYLLMGYILVSYVYNLSKEAVSKSSDATKKKFESAKEGDVQLNEIGRLAQFSSFLTPLILMVMGSAINCTVNKDSLFLPAEFGPRFMFDCAALLHSIIYIIICVTVCRV